jgi:hypothetical protein
MNHWYGYAHLYLYDIPGERFADAAILAQDYDVWSDDMCTKMKTGYYKVGGNQHNLGFIDAYAELMAMRNGHSPTYEEVVHAYKLAMGEMACNSFYDVCPSSFTMDKHGEHFMEDGIIPLYDKKVPLRDAIEQVAPKRYSGIAPHEFAPLSKKIRDKNAVLADTMRKHYNDYVNKQHRLFRVLRSCDGLIVLVDIATILQKGSQQLRESYEFLEKMLHVLDPHRGHLTPVLQILGMTRAISRVAAVASQCDRFHTDDRPILKNLVKRLLSPPLEKIGGIEHESFYCSAVNSTKYVDDKTLRGITEYGKPEVVLPVSRLPASWDTSPQFPEDWNPADFKDIPRVFPPIPKLPTIPPEQTGVNDILRFITGW